MPRQPSDAPRENSWITTEVRVRYAETDQMGMVYYANYLVWFEVGRAEFCRRSGLVYRDFERQNEAYLAVAKAQCRYHAPARYDDVLVIRTRIAELRKRTVRFQYEIIRRQPEMLVASGSTLHVMLDTQGRPKAFPPAFRGYLQ